MGLKNVQISEELFIALLKYHLVEIDAVLPEIKKGLEELEQGLGKNSSEVHKKAREICSR